MKIVTQKNGAYVLKFAAGEAYPDVFIRFLNRKKIRGGFFAGLGACVNPEISFYDLKNKKYETRRLRGDFEVLSITGNVAESESKMIVHPHTKNFGVGVHQHIALGDKNFKAIGGHLQSLIVGGTLEVFLTPTPTLKRKIDRITGLNLFE